MNRVPVRLGPLALLLTVIAICMSTLGVLSAADAAADLRLAERYAETVRIRYALEEEGQRFVQAYDHGETAENEQTFARSGYTLTVVLQKQADSTAVQEWKLRRDWEENTEMDDLWTGE